MVFNLHILIATINDLKVKLNITIGLWYVKVICGESSYPESFQVKGMLGVYVKLKSYSIRNGF